MSRILVLRPFDEMYEHDHVRLWPQNGLGEGAEQGGVLGNTLGYDSATRLLDFEHIETVNVREPTKSDIDRYNAEFEYLLLYGSDFVKVAKDWYITADVLKRIKIPIVAMGIGVDAAVQHLLPLKEEAVRILRIVADNCVSIGVRGAYTAAVLEDVGILNQRIVGCPTFFRSMNPYHSIVLPPLDEVKEVGITFDRDAERRRIFGLTRDLSVFRNLVLDMQGRFNVALLGQGEIRNVWGPFPSDIGTRSRSVELGGSEMLLDDVYWSDEVHLKLEVKRRDPRTFEDIELHAREMDFVVGFQIQSNALALANGIPAVSFLYPTRADEVVETFAKPNYRLDNERRFILEEYWDQGIFDRFNRAYRYRYREMRRFLDENAISHRMSCETAKAAIK